MAKSIIKNSRKVHAGPSTDPSLDNRVYYLENNEYKVTYYEVISGTSGTLTVPTSATINEGEFGSSGNAILSEIDVNQKPTFKTPQTAGGIFVTASLNAVTGSWLSSGVYTSANVALIYSISILAKDYQNLNYNRIVESEELDYDLATQAAVDAGTVNDQIVTPKTLKNSSQWGLKEDVINKTTDFTVLNDILYPTVNAVNNALLPTRSPFHTATTVDFTGTTAASIVYEQLIPAGTLKGGDVLRVQFKMYRVSGVNSAWLRLYHSTLPAVVGTRIAQNASGTGGTVANMTRNFRVTPDGLNLTFISGAIGFASDETVLSSLANEVSIPFNVNVDNYLKIGIEMGTAADVYRLFYVYSQIIRP